MKNQQYPNVHTTKESKPFIKALQQYAVSDRMFYYFGRDFAMIADRTMHERLTQFVTGYNDALEWLDNE